MGLGLALNPMTGILKRRPCEEMTRDTGKMPSDKGGRDWSEAAATQGTPENAGERRRTPATTTSLGERQGTESRSL